MSVIRTFESSTLLIIGSKRRSRHCDLDAVVQEANRLRSNSRLSALLFGEAACLRKTLRSTCDDLSEGNKTRNRIDSFINLELFLIVSRKERRLVEKSRTAGPVARENVVRFGRTRVELESVARQRIDGRFCRNGTN